MSSHDNQYLIRVSAENWKAVKVVDFVPNRYVTKISGANGAGKTSALDAIFYALAPRKTLSADFIRKGQKKGFLRIETNTHIITRKLDDKGGGLQIEQKGSGTLVKAPDDWLEGIAGELGFDPLKFKGLKPNEQFEVLKGLVDLEADIDDLSLRNDDDADVITKKRAEARRLEATRDNTAVDKSLPTEPVDIGALLREAQAVSEHNETINAESRRRRGILDNLERAKGEADKLRQQLAGIEAEINTFTSIADQWKPLGEIKDRAQLDDRISSATENNTAIIANNSRREQRERLDKDVDNLKDELTKLEETVRGRKLAIARALEKAKFPVPGLSFETIEEGSAGRERKNPKKIVTYNGIPLADASSAEQIRVSTAIGMAGKPDLRFLLIREGSLLDDEGWKILEQMAHEHDFQILAEIVDKSGKVGIFMEDGEIKTVNADPAETPAPAPRGKKKAKNEKQGELIK